MRTRTFKRLMRFVDLPDEIISIVLKDLNSAALQRFVRCRQTVACAYREIHTRTSVEIQIGPQQFHPDHYDFGIYASRAENTDVCCNSVEQLSDGRNQEILKLACSIILSANVSDTNLSQIEECLCQMTRILLISREKKLKLHFHVSSALHLRTILMASKALCEIASLKVSLKLEIPLNSLQLLCEQIGDLRVASLNIYVVTTAQTMCANALKLGLNIDTERLKIKSIHRLPQLDLSGPSLKWLEIDLPVDECARLFEQELTQFPNLNDLRLFQIGNSQSLDYFVYFPYPNTLRNLYLYFEELISNSDAITLYRRNHQLRYLNLADKRTSIAYRK